MTEVTVEGISTGLYLTLTFVMTWVPQGDGNTSLELRSLMEQTCHYFPIEAIWGLHESILNVFE